MSPQVFHIERLSISRMPGFPKGLRLPERFSKRMVIFIGANGSGKTSTSKAILKSIWADNTRNYTLDSSAVIGTEPWYTRLDSGYVERQRSGQVVELDGLPPPEDQNQYLLAMHQLVVDDDIALAEEINRQLSGGYDLSKAGAGLSFSSNVNTKAISESKDLQKAKAQVAAEQRKQEELKRKEEGVAALNQKLESLNLELQREKRYDAELRVRKAQVAQDEAQEAFSLFPDELAHFTMRDAEDVDNWHKDTESLSREQESLLAEQVELQQKVEQLKLPETGLTREQVNQVSILKETIESLAKEIEEQEKGLAEAQMKLKAAAANMGLSNPEAEWPGLQVAELKGLEQEWANAHASKMNHQQLMAEVVRLKQQLDSLPGDIPGGDSLVNGLTFLSRWLQEQQTGGSTSKTAPWIPFAWTILTVLIVVLAYVIPSPWWIFAALAVAGFLLYLSFKPGKAAEATAGTHFRQEYERTGLAVPKNWQPEGVSETIQQLTELMKAATSKADWANQIEKLTPKLEESKAEVAEVEEKLTTQREALGMAPIEIETDQIGSFYWLVANAKNWQQAQNDVNSIRLKLGEATDEISTQIEQFNALMTSVSWSTVKDAAACRLATRSLLEVDAEWRTAQSEIKALEIQITGKKEQIARNESQLNGVYSRLMINENHRHQVQALAERYNAYSAAKQVLESSDMELGNAKSRREDDPNYAAEQEGRDSLSVADIETKISELKNLQSERAELQKIIGGQYALIEERRGGRALEAALTEQDARLEELEGAFEQNLERYTGQVVMDALRDTHHQKNDSSLFKKADELFGAITQNRYSLLQPDGAQKTFRARDEVRGVGLGLSELSTGTRIQLLLAVRLAFIETQEKQYRLPLLADELLGNSDDVRADAIIEALVEVCKSGRQVFYFTAQNDELRKWQTYLKKDGDIDFQVVELDGGSEARLNFSEEEPRIDVLSVEAPSGLSHREYGERIGVERFDPLHHSIAQLHLWYLIDDVELLYNALKNGITRWGQMQRLGDKQPHFAGADWPRTYAQLQKRVGVVEAAMDQHRKGRGTPIDRSVLLDSGAITDSFIDETTALLETVNGDPDTLLQQLKDGVVKRFRESSREDLADYLHSKGLLPVGDIPTSHDWWSEVDIAAVKAGLEASETRRVLARFDFVPKSQ